MSTAIPLTDDQRVSHLLARRLYQHFCEHRDKEMSPPPYTPGWAQAYADIAIGYLGYDEVSLEALTEHYK